jgi:hypothetical protein
MRIKSYNLECLLSHLNTEASEITELHREKFTL